MQRDAFRLDHRADFVDGVYTAGRCEQVQEVQKYEEQEERSQRKSAGRHLVCHRNSSVVREQSPELKSRGGYSLGDFEAVPRPKHRCFRLDFAGFEYYTSARQHAVLDPKAFLTAKN